MTYTDIPRDSVASVRDNLRQRARTRRRHGVDPYTGGWPTAEAEAEAYDDAASKLDDLLGEDTSPEVEEGHA
jgi:hypothetical protein